MKSLLWLFLSGSPIVSALVGCGSPTAISELAQCQPITPPVSVKPEYDLPAVRVKWIRVPLPRLAEFSADYTATAGLQGRLIAGLSIPPTDAEDGYCVVLVPDMERNDDLAMRALGHEVAHCFMGRWHDSWDGALDAKKAHAAIPGAEMRKIILKEIERYFPEYMPEIMEFLNGESK